MAYDRYDPRREGSRWRDERPPERGPRDEHRHSGHRGSGREDRGWFERAGEELSSWFGGNEDDGHRDQHRGEQMRDRHPDDGRGGFFGWGGEEDRQQHRGDRDQQYRAEQHRHREPSQGHREMWGGGDRDYGRSDQHREPSGGYRPVTGDYGRGSDRERSDQLYAASGIPRGGFGRGEEHRSQSHWDRDQHRSSSGSGSRDFDPHYQAWRDRHMGELDRDYHAYRQEHQSRFENDFGGWRERRQQKRGMLGQVQEHMEVVGNDGSHVGTVDKVAGERIILTKADPESGGTHHSIGCSMVDRIEEGRVILDCSADDARKHWHSEEHSRALFERQDQGSDSPHMLDRSFSGTYRD